MGNGDRFGLDGATWRWLTEEALPGVGVNGVSRLEGGSTNEMLLLTTARRDERHEDDETLTPTARPRDTELLPFVERCLDSARAGCPLTATDADALRGLAARTAHQVAPYAATTGWCTTTSTPKNVLVRREEGRWRVRAVLDWEQAYTRHRPLVAEPRRLSPAPCGFVSDR